MGKLRENINKSALLQAFIVNALIMALFLLIMHPYLENQADVIMQDLIYGNYEAGAPTDAVLFSSFLLADVMTGLGGLMPGLPWYLIFHCACCFFALVVITDLIFRRAAGYEAKLLMTGLCIYLGYECYVVPGYLKTACLLSIASVSLLAGFILDEAAHKKACLIMGILTGILASLTAFFVFAVFFALCAVLCLIYILAARPCSSAKPCIAAKPCSSANPGSDKKALRRRLIAGIAAAGCIYVAGAGLYYLDRLHYFSDPSLSASIAYRLGYEKCLSFGVPYFKYRDAELKAANDAVYRLGALDTELVDTNERLIYMAQARLFPTLYEIGNFFTFEPDHISHAPLLYFWGFLAYLLLRYGGKRGRTAVAVSAVSGIFTLFFMRQFLILGYYRMYTLEIMPFVFFLMLWADCIDYRPPAAGEEGSRRLLLAADVLLAVFLGFIIFGADLPVKKDMVHETEVLYVEDDSTAQIDTEAEDQ